MPFEATIKFSIKGHNIFFNIGAIGGDTVYLDDLKKNIN